MNPSEDVDVSLRGLLRVVLAVAVFLAGLMVAGVFSSSTPAAPQDCLPPPVGCPPTVPSLPLPTVSVPLPTTEPSATETSPTTTGTPTATTDATGTGAAEPTAEEAALVAHATVRVHGRGARRVVEIRLVLSRSADVSALLRRSSSVLARRRFAAPAGSSVLRMTVGRRPKAGPATLSLMHRPASGAGVRATYRLRLPK